MSSGSQYVFIELIIWPISFPIITHSCYSVSGINHSILSIALQQFITPILQLLMFQNLQSEKPSHKNKIAQTT